MNKEIKCNLRITHHRMINAFSHSSQAKALQVVDEKMHSNQQFAFIAKKIQKELQDFGYAVYLSPKESETTKQAEQIWKTKAESWKQLRELLLCGRRIK